MRKRWWILIIVIVVPIFGIVISRVFSQVKFNHQVEQLSAQGFPVSLDDLEKAYALPEGVPNAADLYIKAFKYYQDPTKFEEQYLPMRGYYRLSDNPLPFPSNVTRALELSVVANQKTLQLLDQAAQIESCRWPRYREVCHFTNDHHSMIRKAMQLLCDRNLLLAQKGETDKLFKSLQTSIALAKTYSTQTSELDLMMSLSLKNEVVKNLEYVLTDTCFQELQLKQLQEQYRQMQNVDLISNMLVTERAKSIEFWRLPLSERNKYLRISPFTKYRSSHPKTTKFFYNAIGYSQKDKAVTLPYYEDFLEAAKLPLHQRTEAFDEISEEVRDFSEWHLYMIEFVSFWPVNGIDLRVLGRLRCAETALAIERYRLKYQTLPESLELLVPEFLTEVPTDPMDNQPLAYIKYVGGYTLYIIGEDGVDNGGASEEQMRELNDGSMPKEYDHPFKVFR